MSYVSTTPEYYQMFQPGTPWQADADGWKESPWVTWGDNPNLVGPRQQGVGCACSGKATSGMGDATPPSKTGLVLSIAGLLTLGAVVWYVEKKGHKTAPKSRRSGSFDRPWRKHRAIPT